MSGVYSQSLSEAQGLVAPPANLDQRAIVLGIASGFTGLNVGLLTAGSAAVSALGYGDAVDTLAHVIDQSGSNGPKFPAGFYGMTTGTAGSYGTLGHSGVTGTCVPANRAANVPRGTYEEKVLIVTGGNVGTAGITYRVSHNNGRTYGNITALGTASTIISAHEGVGFTLDPPAASLVALVNDIRAMAILHFPKTSSSVHGSADSTSDDGFGAACATNAEAITLVNQLRAGIILHYARGSTVHLTADITSGVGMPVAAVTQEDARVLANFLRASLNAHEVDNTYHTGDDNNLVSSPVLAASTLVAGDYWTVRTLAPTPGSSDIDAASDALVATTLDFTLIILEFPLTAALAANVSTMLDDLKAVGKRCTVLARSRIPDAETAETDATWKAAVAADFVGFTDSRICVRTGYGYITDAITSRQYFRSTFAQFAADVVRVGRSVMPVSPSERPAGESRVTLVDSTGTLIGHDEGSRGQGLFLADEDQGNRFACEMRLPDANAREAVYDTIAFVLYGAGEKIQTLPARRVCNALEREAQSAGTSLLGSDVFYNAPDATIPGSSYTLTAKSRAKIHGVIFSRLSSLFGGDIQNASDGSLDTGLVQVIPAITVTAAKLVTVSYTLAPRIKGVLLSLTGTLSIQE